MVITVYIGNFNQIKHAIGVEIRANKPIAKRIFLVKEMLDIYIKVLRLQSIMKNILIVEDKMD